MNMSSLRSAALAALKRFNGIADDFDFFELKLTSTPITARTRRLRAIWIVEDDQEPQCEVDPSVEADPETRALLRKILDSVTT